MKIAVIGAGVWGKNLVNNFAELGALYAVADAVEANREWVRENHPDIAVFPDAETLFAAGGLDAVAIATPPHTHHAIAKKAMELGLDAFVEKPLTLDIAEAEDLAKTAEETGRILMVGHLLMYQPAIAFIKDYLDSGKLGKIYTLTQRRSKLGRVRKVENVLWSFGVHDVAVLLHLVGEEPNEVVSFGHAGITPGIEDDMHLHLTFPSGIKANLHNSWLWPRIERELIIIGEKGILIFDELNSQVLLHKKTVDSELIHNDDGCEVIFEGTSQPLRIELGHFIECCKKRIIPHSGSKSGLGVVKILSHSD
ncbi:MAG: Gfo/Idh/MocA family protein [Chthoniobacterales bacterium]